MDYKISQIEPYVGQEELSNLIRVIENKWLTEGPFSEEFLSIIKQFTGAKHALLTNNGTLALYLALKALGIQTGDEVIVPDFTFNASGSSVVFAGGKPVFVDVDRQNYNIDVTKIEAAISSKTKAIMPVHIYGQSADLYPIMKIAKRYNIKVLEDAAQAYGVFYRGKHTGTIGDIGMISFFADKTVTAGEGGVLLTDNDSLYERLQYLRNQGRLDSGTFVHKQLGMNFRMTDLQCAVGVAQLKKYQEIEGLKLNNFRLYKKLLSDMDEIKVMEEVDHSNLVPFRFAAIAKDLKALIDHLEARGIQTRRFFYPLHNQPCFESLGFRTKPYPNSDYLYKNGLALPVFPGLKKEQIVYICNCIENFYK